MVFSDTNNDGTPEILQENAYYPFGMNIEELSHSSQLPENKYLYNGKELNDDFGLDLYDFGARWLDTKGGVWYSVDPLAEEFSSWSPYSFSFNNPIRFIDPDGMEPEDIVLRGKNNSSVTIVTDLIDVTADVSSFGVDFGGNYSLGGSDVVHTGLDIVGIVDPSGTADIINAGLYAKEGNYVDVAISGAGVVIIGDLLKGGRIAKGIDKIRKTLSKDPGLGNQFKNKTVKQVNEAMDKHVKTGKLEKKYTDPVSGSTSYKNTKSGHSYNVDTGKSGRTGKKVEPAHIDANYPNPKPKNVPSKKKLPIKDY